nr:immunoglobulin light chain junction region [Macaca mulatta]
CMVALEFPYSF